MAKSSRAVTHLARTIARVGADLWCLQEVGSLESLELLNERLKQPFAFVGLLPGNSNRSIHLGYLARFKLSLTSHRHRRLHDAAGKVLFDHVVPPDKTTQAQRQPLQLQRDFLQADLDTDQGPLTLLNVHLKSRTNPPWREQPADQVRTAEALSLRQLIEQLLHQDPQRALVVAGDFNDTWHSEALTPIRELNMLDPLGQQLRQLGRNPSTYWPKRRNRIDYILLSPAANRWAGKSEIAVHEQARIASDHYPVVQDLTVTRRLVVE